MFTKPKGLEKEYDEICIQQQSFDPQNVTLISKVPLPLNYTLNTVTTDTTFISEVENFRDEMRKTDPELYWYTKEQFHNTIVGLIPLVGRNLPDVGEKYNATESEILEQRTQIIELISEVLTKYPKELVMRVCGFSTNSIAASILCYPVNFDLYDMRADIRNALGIEGKRYIPTFEKIAWLNLTRYTHIPSQAFTNMLKSSSELDFGEVAFKPHLRQNASSTLSDNEVSKSIVVWEF